MYRSLTIFLREKASIFLLLLILIRLVPFNLLHYHNGVFAGFKAISVNAETNEEQLIPLTNSCSFHEFLDLINTGFLLNVEAEASSSDSFISHVVFYHDSKTDIYFIDILNKGSPLPA